MGNVKSKMSDPSSSVDEINIPEVTDFSAEFIYNYHADDERVNPVSGDLINFPLNKIPRYVSIKWTPPTLSTFEKERSKTNVSLSNRSSIQANSEKLISEDASLNVKYYQHTFSNSDMIDQGANDLEIYSRLSGQPAESMVKMAESQIKNVVAATNSSMNNDTQTARLGELLDSYTKLSNFPKTSLGLKIVNQNGKELDDQKELLNSISDSILTRIKMHGSIIPDIFENSKEKTAADRSKEFNAIYTNKVNIPSDNRDLVLVDPIKTDGNDKASYSYMRNPVAIKGYVIDRYMAIGNRLEKQVTFYVEDPAKSSYADRSVLYGETYLYTIKVVAAVQMLLYTSPEERITTTQLATVYVTSRNSTATIECFEYIPPPPPEDIKFSFDYAKMNLILHWEMPPNPQRDIKQFQVFRRKTIKEPFELIAQYGFDTSNPGSTGKKYITSEVVDANNVSNMLEDNKKLVKNVNYPVYSHVDEDFSIDTEFFVSSEYIYALCSVDAHGMISNYSEQWHVKFDSNTNRLVTKSICGSGSPKQYPNMNLKIDTFKDTIHIEGKNLRKMQIHFSPEYLKVKDSISPTQYYKIVEAQTPLPDSKNAYYLLQLINLDNQKLQTVKINILDEEGITTV